ncbi:MAG: hypothetical protein RQ754_09200 [Desulfuromonadales bacterium]|nr:hypothetical protein [Desulfuromonadales bacterium]
MKNKIVNWLFIAVCLTTIFGCGGDSSKSTAAQDLIDNTLPPVTGTTETGGSVALLEGLSDLGDLVSPEGDHWYFSTSSFIHNNGRIIGQSNRGWPTKAAFLWDPATSLMEFLGIHSGIYNDYYNQKIINPVDPPYGFIYSEAVDLNADNVVICNSLAGTDADKLEKRAFVWFDGEIIDLPPILDQYLGGEILDEDENFKPKIRSFSEAIDINEQGEIVLTAEDATGRHAYYWDGFSYKEITLARDDETTFDLTVPSYKLLGGIVGQDSAPVGINENGQAVINSGNTAVFHDLNWGVVETLNYLPGASKTVAVDINDSAFTNNDNIPDGHIIGNSGNGSLAISDDNTVRGFFWDGGAMYPVDHLGGGTSVTTDINNSDQVVGAATTDSGSYHAYIWTLDPVTEKGVMMDLGTLGGDNSFATAINESGQVTGWAETGEFYNEEDVVVPIRHAFLWRDGVMYDLGTHSDFYDYPFIPSFPFSTGVDINDSGEVTGSSFTINNHHRGFQLTPVFP